MFETGAELKKSEGIGGFVARHFGPVVDIDLAREGTRDVALVLMCVAGLSGTLGWYLFGPGALLTAVILGVPAVILRLTPSRAAAIVLLVLTAASAILSLPRVLPWVWVLFALRGTQLTFGYHRLRKAIPKVGHLPTADGAPDASGEERVLPRI